MAGAESAPVSAPAQSQSSAGGSAPSSVAWGPGVTLGVHPNWDHVPPGQGQTTTRGSKDRAGDVPSGNWAGLVQTGTTYTAISASWTVPTIRAATHQTVSATWIGIDGYLNQDLIQAGTEQDTVDTQNGWTTNYYAWYEILPAAETPLFPVSPGDQMSSQISQVSLSPDLWTIEIEDVTTGVSSTFTTPSNAQYRGPATSAEWIEEMTEVTGETQPPLANFGTAEFTGLSDTPTNESLNSSTLVDMVNGSGNIIAYPIQPSGNALTVYYGEPSQTSITANPSSVVALTSVTYSASVTTNVEGLPTPTGSVTFSSGSTLLCNATLTNGSGSCSSRAAPSGSDTVTGEYSGDAVFSVSSGSTSITVTAVTPAGFTTSISAPSSNTVGNTWTDSATVFGDSTGLNPTGSVAFTWCEVVSPSTSCTGTGGGGTAGTLSTPTISGNNSTFGPSNPIAPSSPGTYCFNAGYTSTSGGYYTSVAQQTDTECFNVTAATPGFTTSITAPSSNSLGNSWTDSATVAGNSSGLAPTGSVSFTWCQAVSPNTSCTGTSGGGTAGTSSTPSVSGDNSTFGPSDLVTPSSVGTYCFNASYTAPEGGNYVSVAQQSDSECFTVATSAPGFTTSVSAPSSNSVGNTWTDSATVFGDSIGLAPAGSVSFTWCEVVSPSTSCTGTGGGGAAGTSNPQSPSGDNSTFGPSDSVTPSSVGTYCFNASYNAPSGGYYASVAQQSDTECFSVTAATPGFTTSISVPSSTTVGNKWTDSATVAGNSTGLAPTGSVAFTWCEEVSPNTSCTGTGGGGEAGTSSTASVSGDNSTFGPSTSVTPSSVGSYCFNASYTATPGGNYVSVPQQSDTECFSVTAATPGLTSSISAPASNTVGNTWTDSATVFGNSTGLAPTGSVSFTWCEAPSSNTSCTGTGAGGTAGTTSTPRVSGDNSTFGPSTSVTPSNAGIYCFNASYTASPGGNYVSVAQQSDTECFTVAALPPPPPPPPPWLPSTGTGWSVPTAASSRSARRSSTARRAASSSSARWSASCPRTTATGTGSMRRTAGSSPSATPASTGRSPGSGSTRPGSGLPHSLNAPIVGHGALVRRQRVLHGRLRRRRLRLRRRPLRRQLPGDRRLLGRGGRGHARRQRQRLLARHRRPGNVYTFGDAPYEGAPGNTGSPVTSAVRTPDGKGYWILIGQRDGVPLR